MPEQRHRDEAERILAQIIDGQDRRLLAEALEQAERRGREMFARLKESSG